MRMTGWTRKAGRTALVMTLMLGLAGCAGAQPPPPGAEPLPGPATHGPEEMHNLLANRVEVAAGQGVQDGKLRIKVSVGTLGHFCVWDTDGRKPGRYFTERWVAARSYGGHRTIVRSVKSLYGSVGFYYPETGVLDKGWTRNGIMWRGHLQKDIPAITWVLCPEFPRAETLGFGVNWKQTEADYDLLLSQDPSAVLKGL